MNHTILIRIAKLVALFGFLLPWVAISCSNQELATMNGLSVAIGRVEGPDGQTQNMGLQFLIIIALLATIAGAAASFLVGDEKQRMRTTLAASAIAIVSAFLGMMLLKDAPRREAAKNSGAASYESQMNAAAGAMIKIEERPGYFLTLVSLAAAAGLSGMALSGRSLPDMPAMGGAMDAIFRRPEDDVAEWDRIANKDDPDQLQEYLLRHPAGRFAELARMKLERLGVAPLERKAPTPPPPPSQSFAPAPPQQSFAVDAPPPPRVQAERSYEPAMERGPQPRTGFSVAAWAAIALIAIGVLGGGGFFVWRTMQTQQAAAAATEAWAAVPREDAGALRAFIAGAPGAHQQEAESALAQLEQNNYAAAQSADTIEAFASFLADFPQSRHAMSAQGRMAELQTIAAMTQPLLGAWAGVITQGEAFFELRANLWVEGRALRGHVEYPTLLCSGRWESGEGAAARGSPWAFAETIEVNSGSCAASVRITLSQQPDGGLAVAYFDPAMNKVVASGVITRALTTTP